jgi:cytochrome c oxidase cbb3-type subunit 3
VTDPSAPRPQGDAPLRNHAFDGIQEYDNDLPRWWVNLFYLTIVASLVYVGYFHFGPGKLGAADLKGGMDQLADLRSKAAGGSFDEGGLKLLLGNADRIAKGKVLYMKMGCLACHGPEATGLVGPNLRDSHWMYGNTLTSIKDVLTVGRMDKGMPGQGSNAPAEDIADLTLYLYDLAKNQPKSGKPIDPAREKELPFPY